MSVLDKTIFFSGNSNSVADDLGKVEVANFSSDVDSALSSHFGWRGKAIAVVGLSLTPDNLRCMSGQLITRGDLELKEKKMAANTIWADAKPNIMLHLTFPSADTFMFSTGGLWSQFVDSQQIPHTFHDSSEGRGGRALISSDERLEGTEPGFCLRMVTQISSLSSAARGVVLRGAIMLFPAKMDDITEAVESKFAGWPGLKIAEVLLPMGPRPSAQWGCPILPFLKPFQPFATDDVAPAVSRLHHAVGYIMRNARIHDGLKSGTEVLNKWAYIRSNPKELVDKTPSIVWPEVPDPEASAGEDLSGKWNK